MRGAALAALIVTALLAGPVRAEAIELFPSECDASPPLEDLVGPYRLSVFPGMLTDGVRSVAASHQSSHPVSLILMGEDLVLQDTSGALRSVSAMSARISRTVAARSAPRNWPRSPAAT